MRLPAATRSRWTAAVLCAAAGAVFALHTVIPASGRITHGFAAYYASARAAREGRAGAWAYDDEAFRAEVERVTEGRAGDIFWANPPAAAALFLPIASLPPETARRIWTWTSAALALLALGLLARTLAPGAAGWIAGAACLLSAPMAQNLAQGQVYVLLLACVAVAIQARLTGRRLLAGALLGLALVTKGTGVPLLLLLAIRREGRMLAGAAGAAAAVALASLPLVGPDTWGAFFRTALPAYLRSPVVAVTAYQTLPGFLRHLFAYDPAWNPAPILRAAPAAAVLIPAASLAALGAAAWAGRRAPIEWTFAAGLLLSVVLIPAAEQHHFVLLFPALFLLARAPTCSFLAAAALLLVPLPYAAAALTRGAAALLAYPRLYGAGLLFALMLSRDEHRRGPG